MTSSRVEMTCLDHCRLTALINYAVAEDRLHVPDVKHLSALRQKLESALCRESADISPDVVTMGSTVLFREIDNGECWTFTLCYPEEANIFQDRVSVLAPIGTALLGQRVADRVDWPVPSGKVQIEIAEIVYQPEAAQRCDQLETIST